LSSFERFQTHSNDFATIGLQPRKITSRSNDIQARSNEIDSWAKIPISFERHPSSLERD
ncbi:hypothetical protein GIB67_038957, partial [Kingdonia uniflora]